MTDSTFEEGDGSVMVDLTNVEEATFEVLPKGVYAVTIADCEYKLSQNSGMPMWSLTLEVTDGDYVGRKLFSHISFSEKALPMAKKTLNRVAPELLAGPFNPEEQASHMQGKECTVKVAVEKYEGDPVNRVKDFLAPGAASGGGFI